MALKKCDTITNIEQLSLILNEIGYIYNLSGDNANALSTFAKCNAYATAINDTTMEAKALNNMAAIQNNMGRLDDALHSFTLSKDLFRLLGNEYEYANTLNNIGGVFEKKGYPDTALEYYEAAHAIYLHQRDAIGLYTTNYELGNLALIKNNIARAEKYFVTASYYADSANTLSTKLGAARYLNKLYAAKGDYRKAYAYLDQYRILADSIRSDQSRMAIMRQQATFDFDLKESMMREDARLQELENKQRLERERIIRYAIIVTAIILAISAWISYRFFRKKRDATMQRKMTDLRMQAINAQMNPHFIFNCIHSIQTKLNSAQPQQAEQSLMQFARLIRKVLDHSTQQMVTLSDERNLLEDYIALERLRLNFPLHYSFHIDESINAHEVSIPPLMLQPIIENAIVHGIKPLKYPGKLDVRVNRLNNLLQVSIVDNGIGLGEANAHDAARKSYGIPLTHERMQHLAAMTRQDATYKTTNNADSDRSTTGTTVLLTIPLQ